MSSDRHREAILILNALILDTTVGLRSLDIFSAIDDKLTLSNNMRAGLSRLSTTHLVLALAKWMEFYEHYKDLVPQKNKSAAKALYKNLQDRGVRDFRNKVVGHIWDKKTRRPLSSEASQALLAMVIGSDEQVFNRWIFDQSATDRTTHLLGLTEEIRDALQVGRAIP